MNDPIEFEESVHPDGLRTLDQLGSADTRMQHFAVRDGGTSRPFGQEDRYENMSSFELLHEVPADERVHFDTARNLCLYAWFVYRFHVVRDETERRGTNSFLSISWHAALCSTVPSHRDARPA